MFAYRGATASRVLALIPTHTLNPHRLIWHFFRVLGHQARKLCLPDRQVIMFNKIPASLHFPLLFFSAYATGVGIILLLWFYFSDIEPMSQKQT